MKWFLSEKLWVFREQGKPSSQTNYDNKVKASAWNVGDLGSIPGLGRYPGEGNGNPLQYSYLENPMDGGAWWTTKIISNFTIHYNMSGFITHLIIFFM